MGKVKELMTDHDEHVVLFLGAKGLYGWTTQNWWDNYYMKDDHKAGSPKPKRTEVARLPLHEALQLIDVFNHMLDKDIEDAWNN